jgi:hypothetical protein
MQICEDFFAGDAPRMIGLINQAKAAANSG